VASHDIPEGWRCVCATVVSGGWCVATVLEREDGTSARVVLLPLLDVAKPPLFEWSLFSSEPQAGGALASRWRFAGG
jgi:hypothetical protein